MRTCGIHLVFLMIGLALVLALTGCEHTGPLRGSGVETVPPAGYVVQKPGAQQWELANDQAD